MKNKITILGWVVGGGGGECLVFEPTDSLSEQNLQLSFLLYFVPLVASARFVFRDLATLEFGWTKVCKARN